MKKLIFIIMTFMILLGCNSKSENFKKETKDGITFIHNFKLPLSDVKLEPELVIGDEEKEEELFSQISDIKEDNEGNIYIVDRKNHRITVFSYEGKFIRTIGNKGEGPAEFNEPVSVGFLDDNILISDTQNRRFQLFDKRGTFIKSYKLEIDSPGFFQINSNNRIYNRSCFFNFGNEETEYPLFNIYDVEFNNIAELGKEEKYKQPFEAYVMNNCSFTIDSKNKIYVNYNVKNKILVFENNFLIRQIDRELFFVPQKPSFKSVNKNGNISLSASYEPISYGLAVDSKDNFYVLTVYNQSVETDDEDYFGIILEIFDNEGILKQVIPIRGIYPTRIYINKENKIYLVDSSEMKVIRYKAIL